MASAIADFDAMHRAPTEEERGLEQEQLDAGLLALPLPDQGLAPVQAHDAAHVAAHDAAHDAAHGQNAAEGTPQGAGASPASSEHQRPQTSLPESPQQAAAEESAADVTADVTADALFSSPAPPLAHTSVLRSARGIAVCLCSVP